MKEKKAKDSSLKARLLSYVIQKLIIVSMGFTIIMGGIAIGLQIKVTNNLQMSQTEAVEERVATWYHERMAEVRMIRDTVERYNLTEDPDADLQGYLAELLEKNSEKGIYDYYIGLNDTTCFFGGGWEPAPGEYDPTTRDWYKDAVKSEDVCVSPAYVDAETGRVVITMSASIKKDGEVIGEGKKR